MLRARLVIIVIGFMGGAGCAFLASAGRALGDCSARRVSYSVSSCCPFTQWYWNGSSCVESGCGCSCSGDCAHTFASFAECADAYDHC